MYYAYVSQVYELEVISSTQSYFLEGLALRFLVLYVVVMWNAQLLIASQAFLVMLAHWYALNALDSFALDEHYQASRPSYDACQRHEQADRPTRPVVPIHTPHEARETALEEGVPHK